MNGFFETGAVGTVATWLAVLVTLCVWSYLVGERGLLRIAQLLLAGLATGYLALNAIREVLIPQLITPVTSSSAHPELVIDLALVAVLVVGRWLPRRLVAVPAAILVGGTVGYALGGAVSGTLLPQLAAGMIPIAAGPGDESHGLRVTAPDVVVVPAVFEGYPPSGGHAVSLVPIRRPVLPVVQEIAHCHKAPRVTRHGTEQLRIAVVRNPNHLLSAVGAECGRDVRRLCKRLKPGKIRQATARPHLSIEQCVE